MAQVRVSVPQTDGEIRVSTDGDDPVVYPVTSLPGAEGEEARGQVLVDQARLERFLAVVDGSAVIVDEPAEMELAGDDTGTALPPFDPDPERSFPSAFGPQED